MSTEPKTPEELAEEAFPPDGNGFSNQHNRNLCLAAIRKQTEQNRPYMQHLLLCKSIQHYGSCDCGLEAVLNAMK